MGSINIAGFSYLKAFLVLVKYDFDVVCVQEMWIGPHAKAPSIPGYNLVEQRREQGTRGGIAIYIRNKLKIVKEVGNEYAQVVQLKLPDSSKVNIANIYVPPASSLSRRKIDESTAYEAVSSVLE